MTKMGKEEIQNLLEKNPHLVEYVEDIKKKIGNPDFYSPLPREVRDEKYPNLIYPTRGKIFIHIYRTQDMEATEYKAIEPILNDIEKEKHKQILKLIVKKAPEKRSVIADSDLKEVLTEFIDGALNLNFRYRVRNQPDRVTFHRWFYILFLHT